MSGNRVPLRTQFEALVDGTNGNTILQPVHATLGHTHFTTTGAIVKHDRDPMKTISLNVTMPDGYLPDLLRLAMKGSPFMDGRITMNTRIDIPPLTGEGDPEDPAGWKFQLTGSQVSEVYDSKPDRRSEPSCPGGNLAIRRSIRSLPT